MRLFEWLGFMATASAVITELAEQWTDLITGDNDARLVSGVDAQRGAFF
jgi:hypothetical protein